MKILILGAKGMLGHDVVEVFKDHDLIITDKEEVDITNPDSLETAFNQNPDLVINCAAYTRVDDAEKEEELCRSINVTGAMYVAAACKKHDTILVHISSDYIFDGENTNGYDENAVANPISIYAKSKADAEPYILEVPKHYLVRSAWLYGTHGRNFVDTIRRLVNEKDELRIVNDQIGNPTYTKDLAQGIKELIGKPYGIYHITNSGNCSWYEFAKAIAAELDSQIPIHPIPTTDYPTPATRPKVSILLNTKLPPLRHWSEALHDYMK